VSYPSSQHPFTPQWMASGVSKGIAIGPPLVLHPPREVDSRRSFQGASTEISRFQEALRLVVSDIEHLIEKTLKEVGSDEAAIFEAHLMMIQDEELTSPILNLIKSESMIPELAIQSVFETQVAVFQAAESDYLRERALDLRDLERQLQAALHPESRPKLRFESDGILVACDLTPSQTLLLDRSRIKGIITEKGGETSHSAIIARTLGIPAITGVRDAIQALKGFTCLAIDGKEGSVFEVGSDRERGYFESLMRQNQSELKSLEAFIGKPSVTHDQHSVRLMANIGGLSDAKAALESDAEGVGLFRTEFLFMGRKSAPGLSEQRKAYSEILNLFPNREVVIRTLDIGGDKPIEYIRIAKEENPFLGVRAIRYCMKDLPLFTTQIKAMLLANGNGNLSIMLPMVSRADEMRAIKTLIDECHEELRKEDDYRAMPYKVGAMVEIPSLIFEMKELKESASFVSVGTNDLMQYSFAVDRMNPELRNLYTPYHLGFLRMMNLLASSAMEAGLSLGICGELGGQDDLLPLWVAMGFDKLSMTPNEVLPKRRLLSKLTTQSCAGLLHEVLGSRGEQEIRSVLSTFHRSLET
jgi:phosphotransferase system enzyme I (PtsI)